MRSDALLANAGAAPAKTPPRRRSGRFLLWLRRVHGWIGLWGALLGLTFGATGMIMNHRAILPVPLKKFEQRSVQLPLAEMPADPQALAALLARELDFAGAIPRIRAEPAHGVTWGERTLIQPEFWQIWFDTPQRAARAEYHVGNRSVKIERLDANFIATLTRLHQAVGVSAAWVLLADSIAGSLMLLSLTGMLLWIRLHPDRLVWMGIGLTPFALAAGLAIFTL